MAVLNNKIVAQFRSVRQTIGNAVSILMAHETDLRNKGRDKDADKITLQRLKLNVLAGQIWEKERKARLKNSLAPQIKAIEGLAKDAAKTSKRIEHFSSALEEAGKLIGLLQTLIGVLK